MRISPEMSLSSGLHRLCRPGLALIGSCESPSEETRGLGALRHPVFVLALGPFLLSMVGSFRSVMRHSTIPLPTCSSVLSLFEGVRVVAFGCDLDAFSGGPRRLWSQVSLTTSTGNSGERRASSFFSAVAAVFCSNS